MPSKLVAITFHRSPVGSNGCVEGLRAAVGVTAGTEENTVLCAFFGDAVFFTLRDADRAAAQRHLDALTGADAVLVVDGASLEARGFDAACVSELFHVVSREHIAEDIRAADAALCF